jgi:NAD(P)-dependent dehydrogenase (short-subunit alcohol dehydrogenase family)
VNAGIIEEMFGIESSTLPIQEVFMEYGLKDKVALVTGTGSQIGIGKAIALTLAREGCTVICNDIVLQDAQKTAAEIEALGQKSLAVKADVSKSAEVSEMVRISLEKFSRIDILVNNAGGAKAMGTFYEQKEADWDLDIGLNLKGVMLCCRAVLPQMLKGRYGKIVSISSGVAKNGAPGFEAYTACKSGIAGFTKSLALEFATSGINVNCIAPGFLATNFGGGQPSGNLQSMAERLVPQKRLTLPQDIANMAAFLASDVSANITGQMYSVDGGYTMTS